MTYSNIATEILQNMSTLLVASLSNKMSEESRTDTLNMISGIVAELSTRK